MTMTTASVNGSPSSLFQNPHREPLEKLVLVIKNDGIDLKVPALSKGWCEKRQFLRYESPRIQDQNGVDILGAKDRWQECTMYMIKDFEWLSNLPFYKFWSNVLFERSISESLISFLQEAPIFYNFESFPNDPSMRELLERLNRDVFLVFARLAISKASKEEFITPVEHAKLLHDQLLTVPMILDICQLYGRENPKIVSTIISKAIELQPAYIEDLKQTVFYLTQAFAGIRQRFGESTITSSIGAVPLSNQVQTSQMMNLNELEDRIVYLLDSSSNISVFLEIYPPAMNLFYTDGFVNEIIQIYAKTIPQMYKRLNYLAPNTKEETVDKYIELKHRLDVTRIELLKIFRLITFDDIAKRLENPDSDSNNASKHVSQFLYVLEKAVREREFILDYQANYPVEVDLQIVGEISPDVDPVKESFIKKSVTAELIEAEQKPNPPIDEATNAVAGPSGTSHQITSYANKVQNPSITMEYSEKTQVEMKSLISQVKDIVSDLGDGFVEICLKHYNYNVGTVIDALFENSLPENLQSIDRQLPYIPPDPAQTAAANDQIYGAERLNVFDNDEFDVMTRDSIDASRVHIGKKKDEYKNFVQLLNDKSYRKDVGNIYEKFSIIQDGYDDEYDDTYDGYDMGVRGIDRASEVEIEGRPLTIPRILRGNDRSEPDADEEEDEESQEANDVNNTQNSRENFVQDPAILRARAEQRRLSKRGGYSSGGGDRAINAQGSQPDVVGKPKGQGNDKNVLANRDKKNTNKASRGNHSRRRGAENKRRQGMVPS